MKIIIEGNPQEIAALELALKDGNVKSVPLDSFFEKGNCSYNNSQAMERVKARARCFDAIRGNKTVST